MATISEIALEDDEELVVYARIDESREIARIHRHTWSNFHYIAADDEYDTVETGSFTQFPFRLAWAITVHKSQGKSFSKVHIDLGARAFAAGQTYVALSRARSLTHLSLERHLTRSDIYVDEALIGFFAKITESGTINSDHARRKDPREIRTELADAIEKAHVMRIEYIHRNGHIGYRTIRGEGIAQKIYQREPYSALEGYCLETHKKCVFNIKNILDLSILDRS